MRHRAWGTLLAGLTGLLLVLAMPDRIAADLMGDIQQGLKTTGKLFGINTIADVADLVAKGFASRRGTQEPQRPAAQATDSVGVVDGLLGQTPSMMTIMMKLLGLDGSQLGAMLVNGIVFLAHIVRHTDTTPSVSDCCNTFSPAFSPVCRLGQIWVPSGHRPSVTPHQQTLKTVPHYSPPFQRPHR